MTDEESKRIASDITSYVKDMMATRLYSLDIPSKILEIARYLVSQNIYEPNGKNDGVPRFLFMDGDWVKETDSGLAWCSGAALWVYRMAGSEIPGNQYKMRLCGNLLDRCKYLNSICESPEPASLVFYRGRRDSDQLNSNNVHHVEIVEIVGDSELVTFGGNVANRFARSVRKLTDKNIHSYAKPWGILA